MATFVRPSGVLVGLAGDIVFIVLPRIKTEPLPPAKSVVVFYGYLVSGKAVRIVSMTVQRA